MLWRWHHVNRDAYTQSNHLPNLLKQLTNACKRCGGTNRQSRAAAASLVKTLGSREGQHGREEAATRRGKWLSLDKGQVRRKGGLQPCEARHARHRCYYLCRKYWVRYRITVRLHVLLLEIEADPELCVLVSWVCWLKSCWNRHPYLLKLFNQIVSTTIWWGEDPTVGTIQLFKELQFIFSQFPWGPASGVSKTALSLLALHVSL